MVREMRHALVGADIGEPRDSERAGGCDTCKNSKNLTAHLVQNHVLDQKTPCISKEIQETCVSRLG